MMKVQLFAMTLLLVLSLVSPHPLHASCKRFPRLCRGRFLLHAFVVKSIKVFVETVAFTFATV